MALFVGAAGFEPATSSSRTTRANRAALRPVGFVICIYSFQTYDKAKLY